MKQQHSFKVILVGFLIIFLTGSAIAQVPPEGKYNTASYPEERKAIEQVSSRLDSTQILNDDCIAVGPEGRVSYGFEEWKKGFEDKHATFKSVTPVPGTYILRVYNGDAAVKNMTLDVVFDTPEGELYITVIRTETYIKQNGKWYFVAGQGTAKMSAAELEEKVKKARTKIN